jgi:hypothetical protein
MWQPWPEGCAVLPMAEIVPSGALEQALPNPNGPPPPPAEPMDPIEPMQPMSGPLQPALDIATLSVDPHAPGVPR